MEARLVTNLSRRGELLAITSHVLAMTWVSRIVENGGRLIYRNIRTHSTWKSSSALLVKKEPVITRSRVLLCSIHGCYIIPNTSIVRAVVFVERPLFVVSCCFVKDVHQHGSVRHFLTCWYFFINDADIPVNLQGYCDLWEVRAWRHKYCKLGKYYTGIHKARSDIRATSQYFTSFSDAQPSLHASWSRS